MVTRKDTINSNSLVLKNTVLFFTVGCRVQELYVDHNKLQTLPLSLARLTNLRRL